MLRFMKNVACAGTQKTAEIKHSAGQKKYLEIFYKNTNVIKKLVRYRNCKNRMQRFS